MAVSSFIGRYKSPVLGLNAMGNQFLPPVHLGLSSTFSPESAARSPLPFPPGARSPVDRSAQSPSRRVAGEQLTVGAVEHIEKPLAVGMHQHLRLTPLTMMSASRFRCCRRNRRSRRASTVVPPRYRRSWPQREDRKATHRLSPGRQLRPHGPPLLFPSRSGRDRDRRNPLSMWSRLRADRHRRRASLVTFFHRGPAVVCRRHSGCPSRDGIPPRNPNPYSPPVMPVISTRSPRGRRGDR